VTVAISSEESDLRRCFEKLAQPVQYVKGVGPKMAKLLERKGIRTVEDLLYFLPRRYEDRRQIEPVSELQVGGRATVLGKVESAGMRYYRKARVFEVRVNDGSGSLTAKWFHGRDAYLQRAFQTGRQVILTGETRGSLWTKEMIHPDYEMMDDEEGPSLHFKRIVPIYSETEGLRQKQIRRIMRTALDHYASCVVSPLPQAVCDRRGLPGIVPSLQQVHFPQHDAEINPYNAWQSEFHRRLIFDDLFYFELAMARRKQDTVSERGISFSMQGRTLDRFLAVLPYRLTEAQNRVLHEIEEDMAADRPMHRLLQGDVGCGKTVVAMAALIRAVENGYQGAIMAPTEILAAQHLSTVKPWAEALGMRTALLTGSLGAKERSDVRQEIQAGGTDIVVGTHALIQETVAFRNLGLVVIDEQHRFGVVQRQSLRDKGWHPDVLVMTATPIPRSLAMTVYGDLDLSVIDERPPGRFRVTTKVCYEAERESVYALIRNELTRGRQAFVIYPLVEASEVLDLRDATRMAEELQKDTFQAFRVGLVHGRMGGPDKEKMMRAFARKQLDILVSTTVVEVGIDIPEASLMIVEHAERFGLSQLHQLRGRIGRSGIPSLCILMTKRGGGDLAARRLRIMAKTDDGFRIAEEDLNIRGPGEFMGTRQSGLPDFPVASILRDGQILQEARDEAFAIAAADPGLEKREHLLLKNVMLRRWGERLNYSKTG
jgi:ATP-dependent DNA helicase RecG